jgi:hypothetical protein
VNLQKDHYSTMEAPGLSSSLRTCTPRVLSHIHLSPPLCITAWAPFSFGSFWRRGGSHFYKNHLCRMSYILRSHAINTTFNNGSLGSHIDEELLPTCTIMDCVRKRLRTNLGTPYVYFSLLTRFPFRLRSLHFSCMAQGMRRTEVALL